MDSHDPRLVSRRRFLATAGAVGAAAWIAPRDLAALALGGRTAAHAADGLVEQFRRAAREATLRVRPLRGNVSLVAGASCNIVALESADGTLLVDGGIVGAKVAAAVADVGRAPIRTVVNTHWHFDHTDANEWLHARGATVVAHENTRRHLATPTRVEDWLGHTFPASPAGALPATVLTTERTLDPGGATVVLTAFQPAHTDSDIAVHLADPDVLCVGDTWWNGAYPFIDYSTGGGIDGMIRAAETSIARARADTIVVPGHGDPGGKADLARYRDMLAAIRDRVAALKTRGRTAAETVAARPTAEFDAAWGGWLIDPATFVRLVYKGV